MLALAFVAIVLAVVVFGALYVRRYNSPDALVGLFVLFTTAAQIMATKIATFDFSLFSVTAPAGVVTITITFLLTDIVNERFGRWQVHRMIAIALMSQIAFAALLLIGTHLPSAPFWQGQGAWDTVLGMVPRIVLASWITFLVTENLDAYLYSVIRRWTKGRFLWVRNVFSSAISLTADTVLFISLAFYGTDIPLLPLMIGQFVCKYLVTVLAVPFMYLSRTLMGRSDDGNLREAI